MKNCLLNRFISIFAFCFVANTSQAALITEITNNYGNISSLVTPAGGLNHFGGTNCNSLQSDSIKITDTKSSDGCNRFYDYFDLEAVNYDSIDSFTLSLTFSATNDALPFLFFSIREDWKVMAASGGNNADTVNKRDIASVDGKTSQDFIFNASNTSVFSDILAKNEFGFWLGDEAFGANNFNLFSATLKIEGTATAVPEPSMLALFGLALLGMTRIKPRKK